MSESNNLLSPLGNHLSRRGFLLGAICTAVLAACGKKSSNSSNSKTNKEAQKLNLAFTSSPFIVGTKQRIGMVLLNPAPVELDELEVAFGQSETSFEDSVKASVYKDTEGGPDYAVVMKKFETPGTYYVQATHKGEKVVAPLQIVPAEKDEVPRTGEKMIPTKTPTTKDAAGVNPICTRKPECSLHGVSLDAALKSNKPLIVLFSTPAFCKTAVCGPVLNLVLEQKENYSNVQFIHVEIYKDDSARKLAPAVSTYKLPSEPVIFFAKSDGTVSNRLDGTFGNAEFKAEIEKIA